MPLSIPEPGSAADWLRYARSDLALSKAPRSKDILLEYLCFHAQQAVEKSVQAVCAVPDEVIEAAGLSDYAVAMRSPGEREPIEEDEYLASVTIAERVVRWAEIIVA